MSDMNDISFPSFLHTTKSILESKKPHESKKWNKSNK